MRGCTQCDASATGACARCGDPVCDDHLPYQSKRCTACERQFAGHLRRRLLPWAFVASLVAIAFVFAMLMYMPRLDTVFENEARRIYVILFVSLFGSILSALSVIQLFKWSARRTFLREIRDPVPDARVVKLP